MNAWTYLEYVRWVGRAKRLQWVNTRSLIASEWISGRADVDGGDCHDVIPQAEVCVNTEIWISRLWVGTDSAEFFITERNIATIYFTIISQKNKRR
jgi:hypothetical protein